MKLPDTGLCRVLFSKQQTTPEEVGRESLANCRERNPLKSLFHAEAND
jgi:hypothetical protein